MSSCAESGRMAAPRALGGGADEEPSFDDTLSKEALR